MSPLAVFVIFGTAHYLYLSLMFFLSHVLTSCSFIVAVAFELRDTSCSFMWVVDSSRRLINKFLEKRCFMGSVPDVTNPPPSDAFLRRVAVDAQVACIYKLHETATVDF